jgi:glycosidase
MDNTLSQDMMEPFIKHVQSCPDCYEELEISYIMLEGMRRLEQDEGIAVNFQQELKKKLKKQLHHVIRQRRWVLRLVLMGICVSLFGILLGYFEQDEHVQMVMQQQIMERGEQYYFHSTKRFIFEAGDYQPPSLQEIHYYGK